MIFSKLHLNIASSNTNRSYLLNKIYWEELLFGKILGLFIPFLSAFYKFIQKAIPSHSFIYAKEEFP
ncbi:hypothetical protein DU57_03835 [Methanosarcina mazei]|uniref:Uncharacterized protein n=1 Tax=Methanosarcina mazei TaxID=2209 RepID=A0A0F8JIS6_METMZ|nr:hypothetical protein DU57_03835 [Methanosarcina mazei]KKG91504.1 hypothetical protein DU59_12810 [Methanosarcina mazei]KKH09269.1 hypothetical protein DU42_02955 [Methanosarcina mazei]